MCAYVEYEIAHNSPRIVRSTFSGGTAELLSVGIASSLLLISCYPQFIVTEMLDYNRMDRQ